MPRRSSSLEEEQVSPIIISDDLSYHLFEILDKRPEIPFEMVNRVMNKGSLRKLVDYSYRNLGPKATVILADRLKDIGYKYSTKGGLSISIDAMIIPEAKWDILKNAEQRVKDIGKQYTEGLITQGEKYNKVVDIWAKSTDDIANEMMNAMKVTPVVGKDGQPVLDEKGAPTLYRKHEPDLYDG